jgi:cytochrome c-type biogenesis protein CcmH/NrfG
MFNRDAARGLIVGLLLGTVLGYFLSRLTVGSPAVATTIAAPLPQAPGASMEAQSRIFAAQQAVQSDPKNTGAWIALGNDYFDSGKPQQAVDAYAKALELDPDNPDVLTDQGVMYRDLKAFDKAIANWEKAQKVNPKHIQSLYNLGVVYAHDMKQPGKAQKAWKKVIELAPSSPQAAQAKDGLASLGAP